MRGIERLVMCGVQTTCAARRARVGKVLGFDVSFVLDATYTTIASRARAR